MHSSARKPTVLLVEACFSAWPMIWVCREWIAVSIAVIISQLQGSRVLAPSIKSSADWGSSIDWLMTCAHPSVLMWLGWPGRLWRLAAYPAGVGKMLGPCGPGGAKSGGRAAVAAAAEAVVEDGREGRFFFPIRDAVREIGAGVGLLACLRLRGLVRLREAVWTCIGGGGGRALGVVWGSASILESESLSGR